jgi:hypothetical protein
VISFIEDEMAGTKPCLQGFRENQNKRKGGCNSTLQITVPFHLHLTAKEIGSRSLLVVEYNSV